MNRKIVALLLAVMLVASSVAAFAAEAERADQYVITNNGVLVVPGNGDPAYEVNCDEIHADSIEEAEQILEEVKKVKILGHYSFGANKFLYSYVNDDGETCYALVKITAEHSKGNNLYTDTSGLPTSGTDSFNHYYTNYSDSSLIGSVTFDAKAFGNGVAFEHTAKKLFTINVKYDCVALIAIKDDEGRLYPVNGASWSAKDNAYAINLAKGDNTISWFGTDGAGYHADADKDHPNIMELRVDMTVNTVETKLDNSPEKSDDVEIRFDYVVRHGAAHHVASDAASAPKTGDAGMAYMTLAALIVMMGAAVVVTRKVRNF